MQKVTFTRSVYPLRPLCLMPRQSSDSLTLTVYCVLEVERIDCPIPTHIATLSAEVNEAFR
jgi:hypothetical protein